MPSKHSENQPSPIRALAETDKPPQLRSDLKAILPTCIDGRRILRCQEVFDRGMSNENFRCDLQDGSSVAIKVNIKHPLEVAQARLQKVCFCSDLLRQAGFPVPAIVATGELPDNRPYLIEEWQPGVAADTLRCEVARCKVWNNLGRMAARWSLLELGSAAQRMCMGFDPDAPTRTWASHVEQLIPAIERDEVLEFSALQKSRLITRLRDLPLERYPRGLCHANLQLDNVMVDPDRLEITAVLDWELARYVPRFLGECSTSFDPPLGNDKEFAVARSTAERLAFTSGWGLSPDGYHQDLLVFYASDILVTLGCYERALTYRNPAGREEVNRLRNLYIRGIQTDLAELRSLLL